MRVDQIYKKYKSQLKRYIAKNISSSDEADDLVQDVFYRFILADREEPIVSVSSWLFRVAKNLVVDKSRRITEKPMPYVVSNEGDELFEQPLSALLLQDTATPETEFFRSMIKERIEESLSELPKEQSVVFELNELHGVSFQEIAEATALPINTLITRKHYAVVYLRKRLSDLYQEIGLLSS